MITEEEAKLIARYERLRRRLRSLDALAERIDGELGDIEWRLPAGYVYPGDPPESGNTAP